MKPASPMTSVEMEAIKSEQAECVRSHLHHHRLCFMLRRVPALIAEVERLRGEVERLRGEVERLTGNCAHCGYPKEKR